MFFLARITILSASANPGVINVPNDYPTIQAAINAATSGDTIQVASGTYLERVVVNKSLTLVGNGAVIDGEKKGNVLTVNVGNVVLSGFTIQNGTNGVVIYGSNATLISNNTIALNDFSGISINYSNATDISGNTILNSSFQGLFFDHSHQNNIKDNIISNNTGNGISLHYSINNKISNNTVTKNRVGLQLTSYSNSNIIWGNSLTFNSFYGLITMNSSGNVISRNNFIENTNQALDDEINKWNDDRAELGNYWSDYDGTDENRDGIGDTPYILNQQNQDNYPLMFVWPDTQAPTANAGPDQTVDEDILVVFNGSVSWDNVGIRNYAWTFMDVTLQTLIGLNPNYTFKTPGLYDVTLNVTDAGGLSDTDMVLITVRDVTPPVVHAGSDQTVRVGTSVAFDASGSSDNVAIISYEWDFGDGANGTGVTTTHTYTQLGTYVVKLTVKDAAGNKATSSVKIEVILIEPFWLIVGIFTVVIFVIIAIYFLKIRKRHGKKASLRRGKKVSNRP